MSITPFIFLTLLTLADPVPNDVLTARVSRLDTATRDHLFSLLVEDREGRALLSKARRKLKLRRDSQVMDIVSVMPPGHPLANAVAGLYVREVRVFYKEGDEWVGPKGKPADLGPLVAQKEVSGTPPLLYAVPMPKIHLNLGRSLLETYITLVHELTHLVDLDFFEEVPLHKIVPSNLKYTWHYPEMRKRGGELEAFTAGMAAFRRLRDARELPLKMPFEDFYNDDGGLSSQNRDKVIDQLLDRFYRDELNYKLEWAVTIAYNNAYDRREHAVQMLEALTEQRLNIDAALDQLPSGTDDGELQQLKRTNRTRTKRFERIKQTSEATMEQLDARFPQGN